MNKQAIFLRKQEERIAKGIYAIFRKQEKELISILEREIKSYEIKSIEDDVRSFIENIRSAIPEYLFSSLQYTMKQAYAQAYKPFSTFLKDYKKNLVFNIETEPAVRFLRSMETLHLSERDGSIFQTTKKEILTILTDGVKLGKSYTQIAKEIRETQPFVFSKSRAQLIAVQETGQAYGWANFEPAREMQNRGYKMEKKWNTVGGGTANNVRETHVQNQEEGWIPLDKIWTATGDMYAPSSDFNCRCAGVTRIIG